MNFLIEINFTKLSFSPPRSREVRNKAKLYLLTGATLILRSSMEGVTASHVVGGISPTSEGSSGM